jgi:hypothetical protein
VNGRKSGAAISGARGINFLSSLRPRRRHSKIPLCLEKRDSGKYGNVEIIIFNISAVACAPHGRRRPGIK